MKWPKSEEKNIFGVGWFWGPRLSSPQLQTTSRVPAGEGKIPSELQSESESDSAIRSPESESESDSERHHQGFAPLIPSTFQFSVVVFLCVKIYLLEQKIDVGWTGTEHSNIGVETGAGGNGPLTFWPKMSTKKSVLTYVKDKKWRR